jgi:hypothetical protein
MCKEMQVVLVGRVVDKKRIIGKNGAQGVADPKKKFRLTLNKLSPLLHCLFLMLMTSPWHTFCRKLMVAPATTIKIVFRLKSGANPKDRELQHKHLKIFQTLHKLKLHLCKSFVSTGTL